MSALTEWYFLDEAQQLGRLFLQLFDKSYVALGVGVVDGALAVVAELVAPRAVCAQRGEGARGRETSGVCAQGKGLRRGCVGDALVGASPGAECDSQ